MRYWMLNVWHIEDAQWIVNWFSPCETRKEWGKRDQGERIGYQFHSFINSQLHPLIIPLLTCQTQCWTLEISREQGSSPFEEVLQPWRQSSNKVIKSWQGGKPCPMGSARFTALSFLLPRECWEVSMVLTWIHHSCHGAPASHHPGRWRISSKGEFSHSVSRGRKLSLWIHKRVSKGLSGEGERHGCLYQRVFVQLVPWVVVGWDYR